MRIAVLTSGGDAPGMNPAVRGVVRRALATGVEVWAVRDGYAGLVRGDLVRADASDVSGIVALGGTVLGTARSDAFRTADGRRSAAGHLVAAGIDGLVVVGGDGSLTGADVLRREWTGHLESLVASDAIPAALAARHPSLQLVGLVGSIDNDFWGTDNTLGCDSALHRIVEAVDTLASTARSHQRTFVVEVMGRHCGFLAVAAAVCTGADYVLVPEAPRADWAEKMCAALHAGRAEGKRKSIVLVAEGASDADGRPLTAQRVKEAVELGLRADTRVTVLGHVQRGGPPSAEDRVMGTVLGAAAVDRLRDHVDPEPVVLGTAGASVRPVPLVEGVARTRAIGVALAERRFDDAFAARGGGVRRAVALPRRARPARHRGADGSPAAGAECRGPGAGDERRDAVVRACGSRPRGGAAGGHGGAAGAARGAGARAVVDGRERHLGAGLHHARHRPRCARPR